MAPTKPRTRTPKTDNLPRVVRGGAWVGTSASIVRAAYRSDSAPTIRYDLLGFRCALRARASRA